MGFTSICLTRTQVTLGYIPPSQFISVAEELDLISTLDFWMLNQICQQLVSWRGQFKSADSLRASVNFSGKTVEHPNCFQQVQNTLKLTGLPPEALAIEVTESVLLEHSKAAARLFADLRHIGISIYLDDFGTGYSSLSYLHQFEVDLLKIDKSFVDISTQAKDQPLIIKTIVALAHAMDIKAIAEGIETQEQLELIQNLGCDFGQGFLFHKPLTLEEMGQLLASDFDHPQAN